MIGFAYFYASVFLLVIGGMCFICSLRCWVLMLQEVRGGKTIVLNLFWPVIFLSQGMLTDNGVKYRKLLLKMWFISSISVIPFILFFSFN